VEVVSVVEEVKECEILNVQVRMRIHLSVYTLPRQTPPDTPSGRFFATTSALLPFGGLPSSAAEDNGSEDNAPEDESGDESGETPAARLLQANP
jgi:hypothetical protein